MPAQCRVGIQLPEVEIRFKDISVHAKATAANRVLPSIMNSYINFFEVYGVLTYRGPSTGSLIVACSVQMPGTIQRVRQHCILLESSQSDMS